MSLANSVSFNTGIGENTFFWCEPASCERVVGKCENTEESDDKCDSTLDDTFVIS